MTIRFIGTGSGKTLLNRNHTSLLFSYQQYNLIVDTGDGISRALLLNGVDFNSLNGILFTHLHPDHFAGFPALIVQMKMLNRKETLDVFVHESLKSVIEESLLRSYLLPDKLSFKVDFKTFIDDKQLTIKNNFRLTARKNSHLFNLEKFQDDYPDLSFYCASILFEVDEKKIVYTSDIGSEDDLLLFGDLIPDIIICEATHLLPSIVINKIININPGKAFLTHYSDSDRLLIDEILTALPISAKEKINLAEDGLTFEI